MSEFFTNTIEQHAGEQQFARLYESNIANIAAYITAPSMSALHIPDLSEGQERNLLISSIDTSNVAFAEQDYQGAVNLLNQLEEIPETLPAGEELIFIRTARLAKGILNERLAGVALEQGELKAATILFMEAINSYASTATVAGRNDEVALRILNCMLHLGNKPGDPFLTLFIEKAFETEVTILNRKDIGDRAVADQLRRSAYARTKSLGGQHHFVNPKDLPSGKLN